MVLTLMMMEECPWIHRVETDASCFEQGIRVNLFEKNDRLHA